jgi:hypothetical protein
LTLEALAADQARYGGDRKWNDRIVKMREGAEVGMRADSIKPETVAAARQWPTLSAYLRPAKSMSLTRQQEFLKKFTFGF